MLTAAGYEVVDLSVDLPPEEFIEKVKTEGAQVRARAMPTLMTTTLVHACKQEKLEEEGLKGKVKTIIGGSAATEDWRAKHRFRRVWQGCLGSG